MTHKHIFKNVVCFKNLYLSQKAAIMDYGHSNIQNMSSWASVFSAMAGSGSSQRCKKQHIIIVVFESCSEML